MRAETLIIEQLTVVFGGLTALSDVSLAAGPDQLQGIIGPNGSGKTTLLDCLSGFRKPARGSVRLNGISLVGLSPQEISHRGVSRTFQTPRLFDSLTAAEHLLIAQRTNGPADPGLLDVIRPDTAQKAWNANAIASMLFSDMPGGVSGLPYGQRRLLELARAVEKRPSVLLLDEPSAGMNALETATLRHALRMLKDLGTTILLVDHNMPFMRSTCDVLIAMDAGQVIARGAPDAVLADSKVVNVYLGQDTC